MTMGEDDTYSIEELAAQAGMTARNVRAYRTRGLLPPPLRRGRVTRYDRAHLERLRDVQQLREAGVPLRMITEAAERGADLSQGGELWRLMVTEESPWSRAAAPQHETHAARTGTPHDAGVSSVDLRSTETDTLVEPVGWEPLHPELVSHLGEDQALRHRLMTLGVVSGSGRLLYGSTDVGWSLQAMTGTGVATGTALSVAAQTAETTRALAELLQSLLAEAGHVVSPAVRDVLVRLTLAVMRDTLAKQLDAVP
jgi:DNA-binding transcriptional MerR regulator